MKTVTHLLAKDLRRYWPLALLIAVGCALSAVRDYYGFALVDTRPVREVLASLLLWPLVFLFVVAIVQEDAPVGDKAFWLTRPIGAGDLLGAKLLLILIGAVIPFVLSDWLFALAIGASQTVAAGIAVESAGLVLMVTLAAALVGALTRSVLQACAWVGVGFIAFMLMIGIFGDNFSTWFSTLPAVPAKPTNGATRLIALSTLAIIGSVTLLHWHYRRRRPIPTVLGMVSLALFSLAIANNIPFDLLPQPEPAPARTLPGTTSLEGFSITALDNTAEGGGLSRGDLRRAPGNRELLASATLGIRVTQQNPNHLAAVSRFTSTVTFANGGIFNCDPITFYRRANDSAVSCWMQRQLGYPNIDPASNDFYVRIASIPEKDQERAAKLGNTLMTRFSVTESTCEREATLPLRRGVSHDLPSARLVLVKAALDKRVADQPGVQIDLRIMKALTIFAPEADERPDSSVLGWRPLTGRIMVLYRRTTNEFSVGTVGVNYSSSLGFRNNLTATWRFSHRLGPGMSAPTPGLSPEWLADAELWILRTEPVSEFTYPMTVENFRIATRPSRLEASDWRHADDNR